MAKDKLKILCLDCKHFFSAVIMINNDETDASNKHKVKCLRNPEAFEKLAMGHYRRDFGIVKEYPQVIECNQKETKE